MRNFNIDFNRVFKTVLIIYAAFFIVGIVFLFVPSFGEHSAFHKEEDAAGVSVEAAVDPRQE